MRIALASAPVVDRDIEYNVQAMIDAAIACSGKAELVLFGESVLQGFNCLCWDYETDKDIAIDLMDTSIQRLRDAARENRIAISFGFIERGENVLYSSQIFIGADGEIVNVFHRVSVGWKYYWLTDWHYREGNSFQAFTYGGKRIAVGLCGDLWTEDRPEEMKALNVDIVLWPVWCDYRADEWNDSVKYEYAKQAALCGDYVLYVNPYCADLTAKDAAAGGAACFKNGSIVKEAPSGESGILIVEL